jgi:hypothetical protein
MFNTLTTQIIGLGCPCLYDLLFFCCSFTFGYTDNKKLRGQITVFINKYLGTIGGLNKNI